MVNILLLPVDSQSFHIYILKYEIFSNPSAKSYVGNKSTVFDKRSTATELLGQI